LGDFGIACSLSKIDKKKDRFVAPEIAAGTSNYTKQSDIYSFGICLYEIAFSKKW
jgi:serine/threonine protein kinase